jgi:hypothetical protein
MQCYDFYTQSKISFTKDVHDNANRYKFYIKEHYTAYLYRDTYEKYCDNMLELWNILSENDGTKLETIEDNEYKNLLICIYEDNTICDADEILDKFGITDDDMIIEPTFYDIYWE